MGWVGMGWDEMRIDENETKTRRDETNRTEPKSMLSNRSLYHLKLCKRILTGTATDYMQRHIGND